MIVKTVVLPCGIAHAFALFTERINEWWPDDRRHVDHPESVIALDATRFCESDPSGKVVALGAVRAWERV